MNRGNLVGLNFDGVVVRRTATLDVLGMPEVVGCRKTIRQLTHRGLEVVLVTSREGQELEVAERFMKVFQFPIKLVGIGRNCDNSRRISTADMSVYVSDQTNDLIPLKGIVPNLLWFSPPTMVPVAISSFVKRAGSHHELLTELSRCLPHKYK